MLWIAFTIILSFIIGSIPTAYLFGRAIKGIDIRNFGSGNVGATNALRVLGKPAGIAVLLIDAFKGFICAFMLAGLAGSRSQALTAEALSIIVGFAAIIGHTFSIFLKFKGGKGVATTLGVLAALAINIPGLKVILLLAVLTWLAALLVFKIVSLASVITAFTLPIYMALLKQPRLAIILSIGLSAFIIFRHKTNLRRLLQGKESRLKS